MRYDPVMTIYPKYLFLCDQQILASAILVKLYEHARLAREELGAAEYDEETDEDYYDPSVYNTPAGIADWFLDLYTVSQVEVALTFLTEKQYITVRNIKNREELKIECNIEKVRQDSKSFNPPPRTLHSAHFTLERAQKRAEARKHFARVTSKDLDRMDAREEERSKVRHHNNRAKKVHLPATLTIEQWLETLNYFDWKCAYCNGKYTVLEHFIPFGHGHGTTWENCVPACGSCNALKQAWNPLSGWGPDMAPIKEGIARVQAYLATRK